MRTRNIKKQVWLNKEEATVLKKSAKKSGLKEEPLLRSLIMGFEPKEKPDDRFYEVMKDMRAIGNNLNQIAHKANATGNIDKDFYNREAKKWNQFILKVKEEFLLPEKSK